MTTNLINIIRHTVKSYLNENVNFTTQNSSTAFNYKQWKRKNVTIRGMKEIGKENDASAMLGQGLYSAALSNKDLAKQYGDVYFVVNGKPKNPKKFNTLNDYEIWFYNNLVMQFSKEQGKDFPDVRDFNKKTTIDKELQKLGYDGIEIKGREMVNYNPKDVMYFKTERELENWAYESYRLGML